MTKAGRTIGCRHGRSHPTRAPCARIAGHLCSGRLTEWPRLRNCSGAMGDAACDTALSCLSRRAAARKPRPGGGQARPDNKSLSEGKVGLQRHLAGGDDGGHIVVERDETVFESFVANEQLAESVESTVADLDNAALSLPRRVTQLALLLPAAIDDMCDIAVRFDDARGALLR